MQEALNHAHVEANLDTALHWNTPTSTTPAPRPFAVRADTNIQRTSQNATQPATTEPTQCSTTCEQDTAAQSTTGVNVYLDDSCHQRGQTRSDGTRAAQIWTCAAPAAPAPGTLHPLQPSAADTGPGAFEYVNESMSGRAAAYQEQITGRAAGSAYKVNEVKFDGYADGVLQEAKGPGYAKFVRNGEFQPWFRGSGALVSQAERQVAAAGGTPITWSVAEQPAVSAINNLFESNGIGINVVYVPSGG